MIFYRFRTTDRLLNGHKELLNQSIYFAHPKQLNDPMEGYREIYWKGDEIVWRNLFRHYLICLERTCVLALLCNDNNGLTPEDIPVHISMDDFPTPQSKKICQDIIDAFFDNEHIELLIKSIITRSTPIRINELTFYLSSVHPLAVEVILQKHEEIKIIPKRASKKFLPDYAIKKLTDGKFVEHIEQLISENDTSEEATNAIFSAQRNLNSQISILSRYNGATEKNRQNAFLIFQDFPEHYALLLENLVYPEWYTACFMSSCENSSVWGHYGDNHKGACLIFESEDESGSDFLSLRGINGWGSNGALYGDIKFKFESVNYEEGFGDIDFFQSLGRLTGSTLNSTWHTLNGKVSNCAVSMQASEEDWRTAYWQNFHRDIVIKSPDWRYENEYRLILCDMMNSHTKPEDRSLNYEFSSLKGIIFGIKTSIEDKIEIMRTIEAKCAEHNRLDFKFYQAYYSPKHKCIKHSELSLLRYSEEKSADE